MHAHTWENSEIRQIQILNQAKQDDWPKETQKKCPIKVIQTTLRAQLSLWACTCIYPHVLFFLPTKHFTCFTTFCLYVQIPFCTGDRSQSCHWPLVLGGLVARIQYFHWLHVSGQKAKPCSKPLQAEASQDQNHPYTIHMKLSANRWTKNLINYYTM